MPDLETERVVMEAEAYWDSSRRRIMGQGACEISSRSYNIDSKPQSSEVTRSVTYVSDESGVRIEVDPA